MTSDTRKDAERYAAEYADKHDPARWDADAMAYAIKRDREQRPDLSAMLVGLAGKRSAGDIVMSYDSANNVWFISVTDPEFKGMIYESSYEITPLEAVQAALKAVEGGKS